MSSHSTPHLFTELVMFSLRKGLRGNHKKSLQRPRTKVRGFFLSYRFPSPENTGMNKTGNENKFGTIDLY